MSDQNKPNEDEFGFEIEKDSANGGAESEEGLSREEAANLLNNFNAIFDDDDQKDE